MKLKEIRFTPTIGEHDVSFKICHAKKFLQEGHQVRLSMFFRGRMITYLNKGEDTLLQIIEELKGYGTPQGSPKLAGKRMQITLNPKR